MANKNGSVVDKVVIQAEAHGPFHPVPTPAPSPPPPPAPTPHLAFTPAVRVGRTNGGNADLFYVLPSGGNAGKTDSNTSNNGAAASSLLFGADGGVVFFSTDGGRTWTNETSGPVVAAMTSAPGTGSSMVRFDAGPAGGGEPFWRGWGAELASDSNKLGPSWTRFSSSSTFEFRVAAGADGAPELQATAVDFAQSFSGLPHAVSCGYAPRLASLGGFGCPFELSPTGFATAIPAGGTEAELYQTAIVYWGGGNNVSQGGIQTSVVSFASTDGGASYVFRGVIANASAHPTSFEGPNENALITLKDGSLMSVVRVDGGDGCLGKSWPELCSGPYEDCKNLAPRPTKQPFHTRTTCDIAT